MAIRNTISVLVVCIVSVLIDNVVSENRGNCVIKEFDTSEWYIGYVNSESINDDHGSNVIIEFNTENITTATIKKDEKFSKYFEVTLENDKLIISTSSLFEKYEDSESEIEPEFEVQLSCVRDNADFMFKQPINDINNHKPEFQNQTYEYTLPMPWPPEFEITNYGPIIVRDDDITNRRVTFSIEDNEYILIDNLKSSENKKQHWASLKPKQHLSLQEDLQLRISAQDEGNPPLTEYSTVIIKKNVIQSVQQDPRFSEVLYKGTYSDSHELTLGKMEIEMDTYVPEITVELNGDLKDHFSLKRNDNQIEIVLKTNLDEELWDESAYILLFLEATNTKAVHTGRTAILIDLPVKEITTTTPLECTTESTTECPPCTTEATTECPIITTTECPVCPTETTTECPVCPTETTTECPTETTTECPACPTDTTTECPACPTDTTTECPVCPTETTTECPVCPTETTTECPVISTTECPPCPTESTTTSDNSSSITTESSSTTECSNTCTPCPPVTECPTSTECPLTTITECPSTCEPCSTITDCPLTCEPSSTVTECPTTECPATTECPTTTELETTTECVTVTCPECPTECPATTECPTTTELETTTECVTVTCPECPTECPVTTECPTTTELETTTEYVTVTCPECPTECPTTTECPSTTELETTTECVTVSCPECPTVCPETTTVPSKPGDLQFVPKDDVVITKNADFTGVLLVVHTTIDPVEKVTYEVSASEYISQRVTIDPNSGNITVLSPLLPTTHRFKIIATSEKSQQTATKNIELNIKPDGTSETSHSLLIIPGVKENKDYPGIIPKYEGNCVYVIVDQQPNAETYCEVNQGTKSIDCKDIDRESIQFAEMNDAAQIQLKLVLDCKNTNLGLNRLIETHPKQNISVKSYSNHYDSDSLRLVNRDSNDDLAYWIRTDSIANNVAEMYVNILIEDDNDNAPKFEMGRNPVVVGYPKKDLVDAVQPKSVITIKATDADIYPNNIIKYEVKGTELFTIHPDSGVIYPQKTMGDVSETVSFQVIASDHENESQYDTLDVKVHMLSTEHISVLDINSGTLENVDAIMESINKEADKIDIYYLSAAVIPKDSDENSRTSRVKRDAVVKENEPDSVTVLRLVVYALDDTTFTPIDSDELFEILKDIEPNNESWFVGDMNPLSNILTYEKNLTGYIVAVSLLSVLLAFVLCGTGAIYYFVIRPRLYDDFSNENSYNSENGDPDNIDVDSPDYKEKCDSNWALSLEEENIYSTGTDIRNPASETIEPWNEKPERKKSVVTFKEMVEEIEIEHM